MLVLFPAHTCNTPPVWAISVAMYEEVLVSYSAERYYLISEIEQKAITCFLDDGDALPPHDQPLVLSVIYGLWDLTKGADAGHIADKVSKVHKQAMAKGLLAENALVVVDMLLPDLTSWTAAAKGTVSNVMSKLQALASVEVVLVAVSDKAGSSPGLQRCQEFLEAVHPGMYEYPLNMVLLGEARVEMLGHDPRMEPAGGSEVFQRACWSAEDAEAVLRTKVRVIDHTEDVAKKDVSALSAPPLLPMLGFLGLIAGAAYWFVWNAASPR